MNSEIVHKFEQAGLGKAPFRFVGMETASDRGYIQNERAGAGLCYTTNLSTTCDYCGTGIQNAFVCESADGKRFKVGCECIKKSGDKGLAKAVSAEEAKKRATTAAKRKEAQLQKQASLLAAFHAGKCEWLKNVPHPKGREGATAHDYVAWCIENHYVGQLVYSLISQSLAE